MSCKTRAKNKGGLIYTLDRNDHFVELDKEWDIFAHENEGQAVRRDNVLGKPIWSFITNDETVYFYELLFNSVREDGQNRNITFRCDSPGCRRFMQMKLSALPDGGIQLSTSVNRSEARDPQPLISGGEDSAVGIITMCGWCKNVAVSKNEWLPLEEAADRLQLFEQTKLPKVSHGICPDCLETIRNSVA